MGDSAKFFDPGQKRGIFWLFKNPRLLFIVLILERKSTSIYGGYDNKCTL